MDESIRAVLSEHGHLLADAAEIGDQDDLYHLGLTSHATVNVMLALEDEFGVEFPETMLKRSTFASVSAIQLALGELVDS